MGPSLVKTFYTVLELQNKVTIRLLHLKRLGAFGVQIKKITVRSFISRITTKNYDIVSKQFKNEGGAWSQCCDNKNKYSLTLI